MVEEIELLRGLGCSFEAAEHNAHQSLLVQGAEPYTLCHLVNTHTLLPTQVVEEIELLRGLGCSFEAAEHNASSKSWNYCFR